MDYTYEDASKIKAQLDSYGIDYSKATMKDLVALNAIAVFTRDLITSSKVMQYYYDFITSNNAYAIAAKEYIVEMCINGCYNRGYSSEALDIMLEMNTDGYYNRCYSREALTVMAETAYIEDENNITREEVYARIKKIIAVLYYPVMMCCLSDPNVLKIASINIRRKGYEGLLDIIGPITEDEANNEDSGVYELIENALLLVVTHFYKEIKFGKTGDIIQDSYYTLEKLRKKDIKSFVNKAKLSNSMDTEEYKASITVEFMTQVLYVTLKTRSSMEKRGNGRGLMSMGDWQFEQLLDTVYEHGYDDRRIDNGIKEIQSTLDNAYIKGLREAYKYITPEIMSDEQMSEMSKVELAGINYKIKTGS